MTRVPPTSPGDAMHPDGSGLVPALLEILVVCGLFIAIAHWFVGFIDFSSLLSQSLSIEERAIGGVFLGGALIQVALVFSWSVFSTDMRNAISMTFRLGNAAAWGAALIAIGIHITTLLVFFVAEPSRAIEPSYRNLVLSTFPVADGWSQEMMFRGYVIYRLARSGAPGFVQIVCSAIAFAAIHIGYVGPDLASTIWPLMGTAILGGFFAWSVRLGGGALAPVVFAHMALIVVAQPWLAMS